MLDSVAVPCAGCHACCRHELVVLFPESGDDVASYDTVKMPSEYGALHVIRQHPDGTCVYLGPDGCTIHDRAPAVCRTFDCRRYFLTVPRDERRQIVRKAKGKASVFDAGRERLATLTKEEREQAVNKRRRSRVPVDKRQMLRTMMVDP